MTPKHWLRAIGSNRTDHTDELFVAIETPLRISGRDDWQREEDVLIDRGMNVRMA